MLAISGLRVDHAMMNLATAKAEECNVNPENLWTVMARWITEVRQDATAVEVSRSRSTPWMLLGAASTTLRMTEFY